VPSEHDFEPLLKKICLLDRKLGEALGRYHAALSSNFPAPNYVLESYPFGSPMFVEGKPPSIKLSQELAPSHFGVSGFPLGIIINGYVEITDYVFGAGAPRRAPHAILKPGDFVGIFEFMDWVTRGKLGSIPDWTISAGATSILCAFNTSNDAFARHLRRQFGPQAINEHAIKNSTSFFVQLMDIQDIRDTFCRWTTDVVYLATDWFQPLLEDEVDVHIRSTGLELIRILGERAWRAAARIRPAASGIAPFFFGGRTNEYAKFTRPELHERQRAIHIFTSLYDLYSGRRPMFVPEKRDGPWGPIGEICAAVLHGYKNDEEPFVLRPEYLTDALPKAVAYLPVENIASDLVEGGSAHERALMNTLNVVDAAARLDEQTDGRSILGEFGNMVEALSVRLPAGKEAGGARNASVATCDVLRSASKGVKFLPMEEGAFFEPYDIKLDKPGAEFFKTCIRFSLTG
jgi:hypothetical protein